MGGFVLRRTFGIRNIANNLRICLSRTMRIGVTVLVGLPGCGKTWFAQNLTRSDGYHLDNAYHFVHVCYDEVMMAMVAGDDVTFKDKRDYILNEINCILLALSTGDHCLCPAGFRPQLDGYVDGSATVLVIDDNMYLRSMRKAVHKVAACYKVGFCQVYLKCSVEESIDVNHSRTSQTRVPDEVIRRMGGRLEEPNTDNKWERYSVVLPAFSDVRQLYTNYFDVLNKSLNDPETPECELLSPVNPKESERRICKKSVVHQCDIALRQIVNGDVQRILSQNDESSNVKKNADIAVLNDKRKTILNEIKVGLISLPHAALQEVEEEAEEKIELNAFLQTLWIERSISGDLNSDNLVR